MVEVRLQKRMVELGVKTIEDYIKYLHANREAETPKLLSLLTTHHTYFFREFIHFEFILRKVLPKLIPILKARKDRTLKVWSAGCSGGQEVYSLAMFLEFHLKRLEPTLNYEILGTDVDTESIALAENGVYHLDELKEVPLPFLQTHWTQGTGDIESFMKAKSSLRKNCQFQIQNLLDLSAKPLPAQPFDLIFCRNVFIYFELRQVATIAKEFLRRLSPSGYLFIGLTESLLGLNIPVESAENSVYIHKANSPQNRALKLLRNLELPHLISHHKPAPPEPTAIESSPQKNEESKAPPLRILCVDDSATILSYLKQVLTPKDGFEVVGTASNGHEASKKIAELKPDAVTLDIHMPVQSGIDFLTFNRVETRPPVVMISSVSRENIDLAGKALALGAADYVEKPAYSNLYERAEEIRTKLRCAVLSHSVGKQHSIAQDPLLKTQIGMRNPEGKLRIIVFQLSSRNVLRTIFNELYDPQPPCVLIIEGGKEALSSISDFLTNELRKKVIAPTEVPSHLAANQTFLFESGTHLKKLHELYNQDKQVSILLLGEITARTAENLKIWKGAQFIIEELESGKGSEMLKGVVSQTVPATSFAYLSNDFLCQRDNEKLKK